MTGSAGLVAAGVVALTVRMVLSLAVVMAVIAVAYLYAKRRGARGSAGARPGRTLRMPRRAGGRNAATALEVVGRVGLTRGAAAVAVRFGDRVVLLAAGETGSTSLVGEMPAAEWDEAHVVREPLEFPGPRTVPTEPRPGFVEALRLATARRAG